MAQIPMRTLVQRFLGADLLELLARSVWGHGVLPRLFESGRDDHDRAADGEQCGRNEDRYLDYQDERWRHRSWSISRGWATTQYTAYTSQAKTRTKKIVDSMEHTVLAVSARGKG